MCKDKHDYFQDDIFPLRDSIFENVPVSIPFAYSKLLEHEYGAHALTNFRYANHVFDGEKMEWVPVECVLPSADLSASADAACFVQSSESRPPSRTTSGLKTFQ